MKVVLTGGGTGGHIYPCLAVAELLKESGHELYYIGNIAATKTLAKSIDEEIVTQRAPYIPFLPIKAYPPPRSFNPFALISWFIKFALATQKCKKYLKENNIDVVFGTGGYVSGPVFAAAILSKTPYIIHNLDANIGLANKVFVKDASALTVAFPTETVVPKNGNVFVTGNPISQDFLYHAQNQRSDNRIRLRSSEIILTKEDEDEDEGLDFSFEEEETIKLLITGGSQGAKSINEMLGSILEDLSSKSKISIHHVTGPQLFDDYVKQHLGGDKYKYPNYTVEPYTHNMPELCKEADIAICRSGAMTTAEMAASQTVPIFIPFPYAANDHQTKNAKSLVDSNAAFMINEKEQSKEEAIELLRNKIYQLITDENLLEQMKENLNQFAKPNAAQDLAKLISTLT